MRDAIAGNMSRRSVSTFSLASEFSPWEELIYFRMRALWCVLENIYSEEVEECARLIGYSTCIGRAHARSAEELRRVRGMSFLLSTYIVRVCLRNGYVTFFSVCCSLGMRDMWKSSNVVVRAEEGMRRLHWVRWRLWSFCTRIVFLAQWNNFIVVNDINYVAEEISNNFQQNFIIK